jgi:hypothetical protein
MVRHRTVATDEERIVFKGSVEWTEKMTETELNLTECNRTVGCSCPLWRVVQLSVASMRKYLKTT